MNTETIKKYVDVKNAISALEIEKDALGAEILAEMLEAGIKKIAYENAEIILSTRKNWKYPDSIKIKEEELKAMKKIAEIDGTATISETQFVTLKQKK